MSSNLTIIFILTGLTFGFAQEYPVMTPDEMAKMIPKKISGFSHSEKYNGRMVKVGTLTYSTLERHFSKNKRKVSIMLFDFNNASIMYRQATSQWKHHPDEENERMVQRSFSISDNTGWEMFDKRINASKIFLGIHNRFYLIIHGEGLELNDLQTIVELLDISNFPHADYAYVDPKHQ